MRHRKVGNNTVGFQEDLSGSLKAEVNVFLNRDTVMRCGLFNNCPDAVIAAIVGVLDAQV